MERSAAWVAARLDPAMAPVGREMPRRGHPGAPVGEGQLPKIAHRGTEGVPLCLMVGDPDRLAGPMLGDQVRVLTFDVADRRWFGGAQRFDLAV